MQRPGLQLRQFYASLVFPCFSIFLFYNSMSILSFELFYVSPFIVHFIFHLTFFGCLETLFFIFYLLSSLAKISVDLDLYGNLEKSCPSLLFHLKSNTKILLETRIINHPFSRVYLFKLDYTTTFANVKLSML